MRRALVIVDIQRDYFPGGAFPLAGPEKAAAAAARVLAGFRESGQPVVHVRHVWDARDAIFLRPGTPGAEIHPVVAPQAGEPVLDKTEPNAFLGTDLSERLDALAADEVVIVGMMTSMCIDSTVRAAAERGHAVRVVADACAAPDLEFRGVALPGAQVHAAFLAALAAGFATVTTADELIAELTPIG
ncbi:cysteine hydrolase family protein [Microbacterium capsulatum]|uniref:Cysteine hydrolase family protein n=1 Tax=Microbacterium capsulatum TaxID=3041921 RepID=A0ABU0XEI6_9MICO|nr:cysteine hydrolase family protein [Microbacterium sp. ASV81]MDQ4213527.1 cysteine hydrolase family protein [Microbacterium sp. ASV81]